MIIVAIITKKRSNNNKCFMCIALKLICIIIIKGPHYLLHYKTTFYEFSFDGVSV